MDDILSQIIAYAPNKIDTELKARSMVQGPRSMYNQGQLVQPSVDGSRPGYSGEKYITPAKRKGADDFPGQKFISVKDESYSDGRKRVKTKAYAEWLKKEQEKHKKNPDRGKHLTNIRREPGLIRIAEAMRFADMHDDAEYMMPNKKAMKSQEKYFDRKMKVFKKGMLEAGDIVYINNLERNIDDVIFIADQLGESPDWVLDMLDERTNFRDFSKGEKDVLKQSPEYKKPRNDYLKVENWLQRNAKKYSNPDTFEKALIKRFGKDNQFVKDMKSNKAFAQVYFSDDFKKTMLNAEVRTSIKPSHLKQLIKSSLYNFNPKIKNAVTAEIKSIFNSENLPRLRTEARKLLNNNKLLSTFGLNQQITGPYAKVIQAEIGRQMWDDINNFRHPRVGTQEMLKAFEQLVAEEFKPMFNEAAKAIGHSKNNKWAKAKEAFGIADNIAWDHKIPSSLIDKGYADIIEYTKVNPTTQNFNARIKNAQFDRPLNQLITKFEKANTLDAKAKIKNKIDILKDDFSKKFGGYLDEISIDLDQKGNLKFYSSASPLKMTDDTVAMLGKSMTQAGEIDNKKLQKVLQDFERHGCGVAAGGRILFAEGTLGGKPTECAQRGITRFINDLKKGNYSKATMNLLKGGGNLIKNILNPMELLKLRNYFGPAALGFMGMWETGVITNDVVRKNTPLNEALANNWLTKSFLPYTQEYARAKNLLESGTVPSNMKKYVKDVVTFNEMLKDMEGIENRKQSRLVDQGGYGMIDGTSVYTKEQEDKDETNLMKKAKTLSENVFTPGTAKELEMKKLYDEMVATRLAKDEYSPILGFKSLKDVRTPDPTGILDYMDVPDPKDADLRPITYMDAEYEDVKTLPASERQMYEDYFTKKGILKPRQSLSELMYDADTTLYDEILKDYNAFQRQKFASKFPGYYGTQEPDRFMEGGIASLNVKK